MNYHAAMSLRNAKDRPTDWVVLPISGTQVRLVYLGRKREIK